MLDFFLRSRALVPGMNRAQRHIRVTVSRRAFADNIRVLRAHVAPSKLCVVMKSDAYGHGLEALLEAAIDAGADRLGICTNDEAAVIRRRYPLQPVMRLRMALPDELEEAAERLDVEEVIGSREAAEFLARLGRRRGRPIAVHLKIDTGMGRTGFLVDDGESVRRVCGLQGLQVRGIMTHLPSADAPSPDGTRTQLAEFHDFVAGLEDVLPDGVLVHSHNSAATVRLPELRRDMVRVGAACYGVRTSRHFRNLDDLRPVMSIISRVMEVRHVPEGRTIGYGSLFRTARSSRIATLPVGFGEGYPRALFNKGVVLIKGHRCPVVGRVSLNVTTVDTTDVPAEICWGDEAVLVGKQGREEMTFEELADLFDGVHTEINLMAGRFNRPEYVD